MLRSQLSVPFRGVDSIGRSRTSGARCQMQKSDPIQPRERQPLPVTSSTWPPAATTRACPNCTSAGTSHATPTRSGASTSERSGRPRTPAWRPAASSSSANTRQPSTTTGAAPRQASSGGCASTPPTNAGSTATRCSRRWSHALATWSSTDSSSPRMSNGPTSPRTSDGTTKTSSGIPSERYSGAPSCERGSTTGKPNADVPTAASRIRPL